MDTSVEDIFERDLLAAMKGAGLGSTPFIWFWPDGASSAAVMTHDVEATAGLALVPDLMDIDDEFGIKASFQLVPEQRYVVSNDLLEIIRKRQCEVNVHGLNHDGNLFRDRKTFLEQSQRINQYMEEFGAKDSGRLACIETSTGSGISISPMTCQCRMLRTWSPNAVGAAPYFLIS